MLLFGALILAFGAGFAVAAALPPGPTVDVQVVPLSYGCDPVVGIQPIVFGLGVRGARCSGGATTYTAVVRGATFEKSCASTSGTRTSALILGLSPGQSYTVTIRAKQKRTGRSARLGSAHKLTVQIPSADAKNWRSTT